MRIIAGKWRGKALTTPSGNDIRPTSDRARGALFNVLTHGKPASQGLRMQDARVLDAFAGTGALGLEAVSRGAVHATFMDNAAASRTVILDNVRACNAQAFTDVLAADATRPPTQEQACDLIFMDPPYGKDLSLKALPALLKAGWIAEDAIACVELGRREAFEIPAGFECLDDRLYGAARIIILARTG